MHAVVRAMNDLLVGASHREMADRKGPAGREDEERQQRFADMLPLMGIEDETRTDKNDAEQAPITNGPGNARAPVDADEPKGRSGQDDGDTPGFGIDLAGPDVPRRATPGPDAAKAGAGQATQSRAGQSEVSHRQSSPGNRISKDTQVTSRKTLTVSRAAGSAAPESGYQVKGPVHASGPVAGTGRPVESESPKMPGPAALGTERGAETTATPAAGAHSDGIAAAQARVANLRAAGQSASALTTGAQEASPKGPKDGLVLRLEAAPGLASETAASSPRLSIPASGGAAGTASGSLTRDIGEQILDSLHASLARGDRQITLRLRPLELGTVLVRLREDGEHITGLLEVAKRDIRHEIEQALPQVLRSLHDAGVQLRRFEVVTSDQGQRDFVRDQMPQGGWPRQHGSGENHDGPPEPGQAHGSRDDASRSAYSQEEPSAHRQGLAAPGRIDMLL